MQIFDTSYLTQHFSKFFALIALCIALLTPAEYTYALTHERSTWNTIFSLEQQNTWISLPQEVTAFAVQVPNGADFFVQAEGELWQHIEIETEDPDLMLIPEVPDFAHEEDQWSEVIFFEAPIQGFRFRVESEVLKNNYLPAPNSQLPTHIEFSFFDTRVERGNGEVSVSSAPLASSSFPIISRSAWGADESLRYTNGSETSTASDRDPTASVIGTQRVQGCNDLNETYPDEFEINEVVYRENGKDLRWPLQYSTKIDKVVVHHTAGENHLERSPKEVMRAVYAYHANSRGWGDIGYNFVIDGNGNIYEGRAGGDYVVGGHVYCSNVHTIGVALMGNFQNASPTGKQIEALQKLLPELADTYGLDLSGDSVFHGMNLPNLLGHKDLGQTACPGENMYELLGTLRRSLRGNEVIQKLRSIERTAEFVGSVEFLRLKPGEEQKLQFQFKNTGNTTWRSGTWLYVVQPKTGVSTRPQKGKKYIAGLLKESSVPPGSTATFEATIRGGFEGGIYSLEFTPVVEQYKISQAAVVQPVEIIPPDWGAFLRPIKTQPEVPRAGERISFLVPIKNIGDTKWTRDHISLQLSANGKRYTSPLNETGVFPNTEGSFSFSLDPFSVKKKYLLRAQILVNGGKMPGIRTFIIPLIIGDAEYKYRLLSERIVKTAVNEHGESSTQVRVMNTGNISWHQNQTKLIVLGNGQRLAFALEEITVYPGEIGTFIAKVIPPKRGLLRYSFWLQTGPRKIFGTRGRWIVRSNALTLPSQTVTQASSVIPASNEGDIRMRLGYQNEFADISSSFDVDIIADGKKIGEGQQNGLLKFQKSEGRIAFNDTNYTSVRLVPQNQRNILTLASWDRRPAWDTSDTYNDNMFRGALELRVYNDEMVLINELPLSEYLKGIAEVSNDAPREKQKAMAILARTYARFYMSSENRKYPGAPYDGDDSPASFQKYLGYSYELRSPNFAQAVRDTEGLVVTYQGNVIKTPYFSQSDGRTRSAEEVWGWTHTPYLQSVEDPFSAGLELQGHGVGLSGKGAEEAAKRGKTYEEIIKYYYQGVEIKRL